MPKKRSPDSKPVGEPQRILLERLDEMGVNMKTASGWIGRNPAYLQQYIFRGTPQYLDEPDRLTISRRTGLPEIELDPRVQIFGDDRGPTRIIMPGPARAKGDKPEIIDYKGPATRSVGATAPIYSAAEGGKGHIIIENDPVDHQRPPEELISVRGAYGILIKGESMAPRYYPGEIAWVHPHRQPKRLDDVVLYHVPAHGEQEAMIKTYLGLANGQYQLRQFNPPLDFTEAKADWPRCHVIVGKKNI